MVRGAKIEFLGHFLLKVLDRLREEFDHPPALRADHMVVMFVVIVMLKIRLVIAKSNLSGESGFRKEFKGAVNGRVANRRIVLLDESMEILDRQMFLRAEKRLHDEFTLAGLPQPQRTNVLDEDLTFCFKPIASSRHN